jgi:hypothetical protein
MNNLERSNENWIRNDFRRIIKKKWFYLKNTFKPAHEITSIKQSPVTIVYDYLERFGEKKLNLEIKSCFKEN